MFDQPRAVLSRALSHDPPLGRLGLHALLVRLCASHVIPLRNCLREPLWQEPLAEIRRQTGLLIKRRDWMVRLAEQLRWTSEEEPTRLLVFCAGLLQTLDTYHRNRRSEILGATVTLPASLGDNRTAFLPPPPTLLADLVPPEKRLVRGTGDLRNDLREILGLWWHVVPYERHVVVPLLQRLNAYLSQAVEERIAEGDLRVALASPFADLAYSIRSDPGRCGTDGTPYRFSELVSDHLEAARSALARILTRCTETRVDLLCFPELTLDTALLGHLRLLLETRNRSQSPLLVVAGSFHVDSGGRWVNRCRILSGKGEILATQDKCVVYRVPAIQAQASPGLRALLGIDERGGYEDIDLSSTLNVLETPLGRLATPICLDFCGDQVRDLLVACGVNLLLVPAMTPEMRPFQERARDLGTQTRAATFVTNSGWLLRQLGKMAPQELALVYLPARSLVEIPREASDPLHVFSIRELLGLP
jgi:hypothetical protein